MRVAVLYGSVRSQREGIKAARFIVAQLRARGHHVDLLDAMELRLPMLDRMHKEFEAGTAPPAMEHAHDVLEQADGFVVVGGEYNHSVPPGLKNLIDHFQSEYFYKPAGIVTYSAGPFGGARVAPHYRAILGELGMVSTSIMFAVSHVQSAFDDDGNDATEDGRYRRRVGRFLNELEWYLRALAHARKEWGDPMEPCGDRALEEAEANRQARALLPEKARSSQGNG